VIKVRDDAFKYYFHFMNERMSIFWRKFYQDSSPWTDDNILLTNKFTNVYRSCDRVSQYLIRNVIYGSGNFNDRDVLFRILIFKIFNKIETWEYLEKNLGEISLSTFNVSYMSKLLSDRIAQTPIFSAAYLMTGCHNEYNKFNSKHERWLQMIEQIFIKERLFDKIMMANSLRDVFLLLKGCPFIGDFLAYQYAIDFNYSEVIDFDENSFVMAGIGAIRGLRKCFTDPAGYSNEELIKYTYDNIDLYRRRYDENEFINLFGREPKLIDLQNCFCETDKYLRVKMPELNLGNTRIKQKYNITPLNISYTFPTKWKLNVKEKDLC
jgi:hypothetical protein